MAGPAYNSALFPTRYRACGVWLRPLALGHCAILARLGNPFAAPVEEDMVIPRALVVSAAYVCSRTWPAAAEGVNRKYARFWMLRRHLATRLRANRDRNALAQYVADSYPEIDFWSEGGCDQGTFGQVQILVSEQRRHFGSSLEEALSVPLAVAIHDHYFLAHSERKITLFDQTDYALMQGLEGAGRG